MPILILHLFAGLLSGALFRIQTLLMLALLVLLEAVCRTAIGGGAITVLWWVAAELVLQVGYLGGVYLRSVLERLGFGGFLYADRHS